MERSFGVTKFRGLLLASSFAAFAEFLMGFLGNVISGHLLGEEALGGVSLVSPVLGFLIFLSALLGNGMGINYSLRMGRCDRRGAAEIFTQGIWSVLVVGGASALALFLLRDAFFDFMAPAAAVRREAVAYWNGLIPVAVLEPLAVMLLNVCYADGDSRLCYVAYVAQLVMNVAVSLLLLRAGLGTVGCAVGVVAGYLAAAAILTGHFFRASNSFSFVRHFSWADTWRICRASIGDASSYVGDAIVFFCLGKVLIVNYGSEMLPVMSVVFAALGLVNLSGGIAVAAQPIVTVYFGERNFKAVRQVMKSVFRVMIAEAAVFTLVLTLFPSAAIALVGIRNPDVAAHAVCAVRIVSIGVVFAMFANVMNNYYQYVERESLSLGLSIWGWLILPLFVLALFSRIGPDAVWTWYPVYNVLGVGLFFAYLRFMDGRERFFLQLPRARDRDISVFTLSLSPEEIVAVSQLVATKLMFAGIASQTCMRAQLMVEEVLMAVFDRNEGRRVLAEVTLDLNDGVALTIRDDGVVFDITDSDARISSLRGYLVASVMERQARKLNLTTTGFNRNVFRF